MKTDGCRLLHSLVVVPTIVAVLGAVVAARPARAVDTVSTLHQFAELFAGVGGYYFTSGSAMQALGNPKFGGTSSFFFRPKVIGQVEITGGPQLFGASDHWQPFSGGNSYSLTGAAFRVRGIPRLNRVFPFVTGGLYYGKINSYNENYDANKIVPSIEVGAEYRFARYLSVTASYRVSGKFGGVNADGFNVGLKFF